MHVCVHAHVKVYTHLFTN